MITTTLSEDQYKYWFSSKKYHCMPNKETFIEYFFNFMEQKLEFNNKYGLVNIYGIQDANVSFNDTGLNMFLSVENCKFWDHYSHYKKYSDYNNNSIHVYLYNHIDKLVKNENYIAIPVIYTRIEYFKKYYEQIKPKFFTPFSQKKFCLQVTCAKAFHRPGHPCKDACDKQNKITTKTLEILNKIGTVDHIQLYNERVGNSSCYNSEELLNLFNEYKFILCFENSFTNGYITEKIFNAFFSRTIPIYIGPEDTNRYINKTAYINGYDLNNKNFYDILALNNDEMLYNDVINKSKINDFDNENFIDISNKFIREKLISLAE
tara:strand:+ start:25597 stop:26556 length:960 start_codon:yes stop_codon:yes gene_type:complete